MRPTPLVRLLACLTVAVCSTAPAQNTAQLSHSPGQALAGLWEVRVSVGSCDPSLPLPPPFVATVQFQPGGTLVETNAMPLAGVPTPFGVSSRNGPGLGSWSYEPRQRRYTASFRFDWWVDGRYDGYQKIERQEIYLSRDGQSYVSTIQAARYRYNPATDSHERIGQFCGESFGERM